MPDTRLSALLLFAVLPACLEASPNDEVGSRSEEVFLSPFWIDTAGVSEFGAKRNGLTKTGSSGWNAGAASVQTLDGPGFVRFTTAENDRAKVLGLRHATVPRTTDSDFSRADIQYGIFLSDTQQRVHIWEGAVTHFNAETYVPGDVFYIETLPAQIKYRKGSPTAPPFHMTTLPAPQLLPFPFEIDTSLLDQDATIRDVAIQGFWNRPSGVKVSSSNDLEKNGSNGWNAGATSWDTISGHGSVSFTTSENTTAKMLGLSRVLEPYGDDGYNRDDIDYGIVLQADGKVAIWENAQIVQSNATTYLANDVFSIVATPGTDTVATSIRYYKGTMWLRTTEISNDATFFPLQVDTSLYTVADPQNNIPAATLKSITINSNPVVHVALQNGFFNRDLNPARRCGINDVISVSGSHFLQVPMQEPAVPPTPEEIETFFATTPAQVKAELVHWAGVQYIDLMTSDTVIMDIENPALKDLWTYDSDSVTQGKIITGYKNRVIGARMAFPRAKLGLYGTLVPDPRGQDPSPRPNPPTVYQRRHDALVAAGNAGETGRLYDGLDYLVPVLYIRYGCENENDSAVCDPDWFTVDAYTRLGITGSRDLKKSDGSSIPVLPLLSFWVEQSDTNPFDDKALIDLGIVQLYPKNPFHGSLSVQMNIFREPTFPEPNYHVTDVVLWRGKESLYGSDQWVRDGEGNQLCWNAGRTAVGLCGGSYTDHVTVDDYTCWL